VDDALYRRMLPVFVAETAQLLDALDHALLALGVNPYHAAARAELVRAAHTIRGNAEALSLRQITLEAQRIELWATLNTPGLTAGMLNDLHDARTALRTLLGEVARDAAVEVA